jgi:predicted P-loop ATPase
MDISRLLPVSMVARVDKPGCQCRSVVILEGPEDQGKSKLVEALAGRAWYRAISFSLESKESHMILQGVWVAELAELASLSKTEDARLKSFITLQSDDYVPKFANAPVSRPRRTVFVGTVNPEGDGTYLRGQTGNTRFLPIPVTAIDLDGFLAIRPQLFAEALAYYKAHPDDWWRLSSDGQAQAQDERGARRQRSVYEDSLGEWLAGRLTTTWEEIAQSYLQLEAKERWKDKGLQMEIAKALRALGWRKKQRWLDGGKVRGWVRGGTPP